MYEKDLSKQEESEENREAADLDAQANVFTALSLIEENKGQELDRQKLRHFFETMGANFEIDENLKEKFKAKHYPSLQRAESMKAVWGEKYKLYKDWCKAYVEDYEKRTGRVLPSLDSGNKTEGMKMFFTDLTSYAICDDEGFSLKDLTERILARGANGRLREQGITGEDYEKRVIRIVIKGYNKEKAFAPASFPSEFPEKMLSFIESWRSFIIGSEK